MLIKVRLFFHRDRGSYLQAHRHKDTCTHKDTEVHTQGHIQTHRGTHSDTRTRVHTGHIDTHKGTHRHIRRGTHTDRNTHTYTQRHRYVHRDTYAQGRFPPSPAPPTFLPRLDKPESPPILPWRLCSLSPCRHRYHVESSGFDMLKLQRTLVPCMIQETSQGRWCCSAWLCPNLVGSLNGWHQKKRYFSYKGAG